MIHRYLFAVTLAIVLLACSSGGGSTGLFTSGSGGNAPDAGDAGPHVGECMTDMDCTSPCADGHCVLTGASSVGECTYDNVHPAGSACRLDDAPTEGACSGLRCVAATCATDADCLAYNIGFCLPSHCDAHGACANGPRCATDTCDPSEMMCFPGVCVVGGKACGVAIATPCCPGLACIPSGTCQPTQ